MYLSFRRLRNTGFIDYFETTLLEMNNFGPPGFQSAAGANPISRNHCRCWCGSGAKTHSDLGVDLIGRGPPRPPAVQYAEREMPGKTFSSASVCAAAGGRIRSRSPTRPASRSTCSDLALARAERKAQAGDVRAHRPAFKGALLGRRHVSFDPYNDAVLLKGMKCYLGVDAILKSSVILQSITMTFFSIFWEFWEQQEKAQSNAFSMELERSKLAAFKVPLQILR